MHHSSFVHFSAFARVSPALGREDSTICSRDRGNRKLQFLFFRLKKACPFAVARWCQKYAKRQDRGGSGQQWFLSLRASQANQGV